MAASLDVNLTILSKMKREKRPFKREIIIKIAEVYNINKEELLTMWPADKICNIVEGENVAFDAIELAKKRTINNVQK